MATFRTAGSLAPTILRDLRYVEERPLLLESTLEFNSVDLLVIP